jgi:hypothetical protein
VLDSPYNNALAHQLNQMCFLAGETPEACCTPVSIDAELYHANDIPSADTACMRIETAGGIPLQFVVTHACCEQEHPTIIIRGSKGTLRWHMRQEMKITWADGTVEDLGVEPGTKHRENIFDALLARLDDPSARIYTVEQAAVHTLCVNAAHTVAPIRNIPSEYVTTVPQRDSTVQAIADINGLVARSVREEKLFSQLDAPWAVANEPMDLTDFDVFGGPASG